MTDAQRIEQLKFIDKKLDELKIIVQTMQKVQE